LQKLPERIGSGLVRGSLLHSLLELAHATSQNLGFAHQDDVHISYGEETITETNLLELRRRHPKTISVNTFGKRTESQNGADWEWHIIGRARKFRMRVQAKRLQKNDRLRISHKVASSGDQQIDLLIDDAKANHLMPVYCFYTSERQRGFWKIGDAASKWNGFEAGCLITSAYTVKAKMPKSLPEIETDCVPWHYLVDQGNFTVKKYSKSSNIGDHSKFLTAISDSVSALRVIDRAALNQFPTLDELNSSQRPKREIRGLAEAGSDDYKRRRSDGEYCERGIGKLVELDVREFPPRLWRTY